MFYYSLSLHLWTRLSLVDINIWRLKMWLVMAYEINFCPAGFLKVDPPYLPLCSVNWDQTNNIQERNAVYKDLPWLWWQREIVQCQNFIRISSNFLNTKLFIFFFYSVWALMILQFYEILPEYYSKSLQVTSLIHEIKNLIICQIKCTKINKTTGKYHSVGPLSPSISSISAWTRCWLQWFQSLMPWKSIHTHILFA